MNGTKSLLVVLILLSNIAAGATASAAEALITKDELSPNSYCHEKFPAIEGRSLPTEDPTLKRPQSGDIIDYYGPCHRDPTGKDQVQEQRLDFQHHFVTEFSLGGE